MYYFPFCWRTVRALCPFLVKRREDYFFMPNTVRVMRGNEQKPYNGSFLALSHRALHLCRPETARMLRIVGLFATEEGNVLLPWRSLLASAPSKKRFCHSMWLFHLHSTVKIRPFIDYSFGISRNKASTIFYDTA